MAQVGDVVETRLSVEHFGRCVTLKFWWKLLNWATNQPTDQFMFAVGLQWLAAIDPWIDVRYALLGCRFHNLTTPEPDFFFHYHVHGQTKPRKVAAVENTVWITRFGEDQFGNSKRSRFPLSNILPAERAGRIEGDSQLSTILEFLTEEHFIIGPVPPIWIGGFINRDNGEFVQTRRAHINPQFRIMRKRTLKTRTRLLPTVPVGFP